MNPEVFDVLDRYTGSTSEVFWYAHVPLTWWATYVRKTVNASPVTGDADQNLPMIVENSSENAVAL